MDISEHKYLRDVPLDFLPIALTDPESFAKDYGCVSRPSLNPFIPDMSIVYRAIDESRDNPFDSDSLMFDKDFKPPKYFAWHTVHIDVGLSGDRLGIAMSHVPYFVHVQRYSEEGDHQDIIYRTELAPFYFVDYLGGVKGSPGEEVQLGNIREACIYTLTRRGFNIGLVTCDGFQSADMLQILVRKGYRAGRLSIDRTVRAPKRVLKQNKMLEYVPCSDPLAAQVGLKVAFRESRVSFPYCQLFINEIEAAEKDDKIRKVDHPKKGSIDVEQAVAGTTFTAGYNTLPNPDIVGEESLERRIAGKSSIEKRRAQELQRDPVDAGFQMGKSASGFGTEELEKRLDEEGGSAEGENIDDYADDLN